MKCKVFIGILIIIIQAQFLYSQQARLVLKQSFPDHNSEVPGDYLVFPYDVVNESGSYYVSDRMDHSLKMFSSDGNFVKELASKGQGPGELIEPAELAIDITNRLIFCIERGNHRIS